MLKNNLRKFIICVIAITMVVLVARTSFASDNGTDILSKLNSITSDGNTQQIPEGENTVKQINEAPANTNTIVNANTNTNTIVNANTNTNVNTNKNTNQPSTTPYTGIESNFSLVFIAIFVVSAIYAYKKIRDYNV